LMAILTAATLMSRSARFPVRSSDHESLMLFDC
jgi:hypothetical protein